MTTNSAPTTVGVCLSGGGFRSALYGLGVLRYLAEAGVLSDVVAVCGVSGGSVAGSALSSGLAEAGPAALSADGFVARVFDPFVTAVTGRDLRNEAVGRWLGSRVHGHRRPRNIMLADRLSDALFPSVDRLGDLPERPQLVITATELTVKAGRKAGRWRRSKSRPRWCSFAAGFSRSEP